MIAVCILGILTVLELIVLIFFGWGVDPANGPQLADHAYGLLFLIAAVLALFALLVLFSVGGAVGRKQDLDYKVDVLQRRVWQMEGKIFASRQSEPASASPAGRGAALPGIRYPAAGPCPGFPGMLYPANLPAIPRAAPGNVPSAGNPAQPPGILAWGRLGPLRLPISEKGIGQGRSLPARQTPFRAKASPPRRRERMAPAIPLVRTGLQRKAAAGNGPCRVKTNRIHADPKRLNKREGLCHTGRGLLIKVFL